MARSNERQPRRPEDWFPPVRSTATPSTANVDAAISAALVPGVRQVISAATVTPSFDDDLVDIITQAVGLTLANPTGTTIEGKKLTVRIKDNGTPIAIGYGAEYRAIGIILPTITVANKQLYLFMMWNDIDSKWDVYQMAQQA